MNDTDSPPVEVLVDVAEAAADLQRLLTLDATWSGADGRAVTDRDRVRLADVGDRVDTELAAADHRIAKIRAAFERYPGWFNARIAEAFQREELTDAQRRDGPAKLAADGDYAARVRTLADALTARVAEERAGLQTKIRTVRGRGPVTTDISGEFVCGIGALASMGAMAAGVGLENPGLFIAGAAGLAVVIIAC